MDENDAIEKIEQHLMEEDSHESKDIFIIIREGKHDEVLSMLHEKGIKVQKNYPEIDAVLLKINMESIIILAEDKNILKIVSARGDIKLTGQPNVNQGSKSFA